MFKIVFVAIALFATSAHASDIPAEWVSCKTSADCDVVSSSCGESMGINVQHKAQAYTEICKTENCSGACDGSARQAYAAVCKAGKCVPDYDAKAPPAPEVHFELKSLEMKCPDDHPNCGVTRTPVK